MEQDRIQKIVSISKQELAELPSASFDGRIILVDSEDDARNAVEELRNQDIIGFDTETRPSFKRGQSNDVALMQLSSRDTCYLFRLNHIGFPAAVKDLLEDGNVLKVGLSIHDDFHNLHKRYPLEPAGFIDLQDYVRQFRIADSSLSKIYAIIFGNRISKSQRLTNWEADDLSVHQQSYAALDAVACVRIYEFLSDRRFHPEKSKYYRLPEPLPDHTNKETDTQQ